jgi:hypothetical protein
VKALYSNRGFKVALIVAGVVVLLEGVALFLSYASLQKEELRERNLSRDFRSMSQVSPSPSEAVARSVKADVAAYEGEVLCLEAALSGGAIAKELDEEAVPRERTDAYFDLVSYTERLRTMARRHAVQIEMEESFGFSEYAKEGPAKKLIGKVFRERQILERALSLLLMSNPARLTLVERSAGSDSEEWEEQTRLSLAVDGVVKTDFVRVEFSGETANLRSWLNRLGQSRLPVSVRSIEVAPEKSIASGNTSRRSNSSLLLTSELPETNPLVARLPSVFTVVLEILEIVPLSEEEDQ